MINTVDNKNAMISDFEKQTGGLPRGVRDIAGWMFVICLLLSIGMWKMQWFDNVISAVISLAILAFIAISLLGYQISKAQHRNEPKPDHLYAYYKKN